MRMLSPLSFTPVVMGDVFDDVDRIVNRFVRPTYVSTANSTYNVHETNDHFLVSMDMPGVKKEDIKIEVQNNQLMISGERQREGDVHTYRKYEKTFTLPKTVSTDKIEAQYENGVLNLAIPKAEAAKARMIEIQSGSSGFFSKLLSSKKDTAKEFKDAN